MKYTLIFFVTLFCLSGCKKNQFGFHVEVEHYYYNEIMNRHSYVINYTNNGWITSHTLRDVFDIGNISDNILMFTDCEEAKRYALKFDSYAKCKHFNDSVETVYQQLLKVAESRAKASQDCEETTKIY